MTTLFGPRLDLWLFIGPLFLALALALLGALGLNLNFALFVLLLPSFDFAHIFAVFPAVLSRLNHRPEFRRNFAFLALAVFILVLAVYLTSESLFTSILAYLALFHILRQQVGWVMIARAKAKDPTPRSLDLLQIYSLMFFPVIWWHSGLSTVSKKYFVPGDLALSFPEQVGWLALTVFILVQAYYWFSYLRKPVRNQAKHLVLASTFIWFFFGLVLPGNSDFFWVSLILIHGLAYIYYVSRMAPTPWNPLQKISVTARLKYFFAFLLLTGICWSTLHFTLYSQSEWKQVLAPLVWTPLLLHYVFDGVIWRKGFFDPRIGV